MLAARCWACQRSYCICNRSQVSGLLPNAFDSRIAISGDTPLWPFSSSDKAFRVTPRPAAAAVTDKPRGFRHSSRMISPGCGGLCISVTLPSCLVIVNEVDIGRVLSVEFEDEPQITRYGNRPLASSAAAKRMKPQPWQTHIAGSFAGVQQREDPPQSRLVLGRHAAEIAR